MKIINAGLGRTGTTSLKAALERLGYGRVYHTTDLFTSKEDMELWDSAMDGAAVDWRSFFRGYDVADFPAGLLYRDIIRAHPDAKVIITVRDAHDWADSINSTFQKVKNVNLPIPMLKRAKGFMEKGMGRIFEGRLGDSEHMARVFERHTREVKDFVGEENVLVYNVREGWEPLCAFLGKEVPDEPFPRLNKRGGMRGMMLRMFGGAKASGEAA